MEGEGPGFDSVFSLLGFTGFLFGFIGCRRVSLGRTELVTSVYGAQSFFITDFYWIFCGSTLISDRRRSYFINSKWFFFIRIDVVLFDLIFFIGPSVKNVPSFYAGRPSPFLFFSLCLYLFIFLFFYIFYFLFSILFCT